MDESAAGVIKQHLIDPEICIRCNTCEATCPVGAITHDDRNYVVDAGKCNLCMACISPCPTGSIDNWRAVPRVQAYSIEAQLGWETLPAELDSQHVDCAQIAPEYAATSSNEAGSKDARSKEAGSKDATRAQVSAEPDAASAPSVFSTSAAPASMHGARFGATLPPWSAAHAYTNLYGPKAAQSSINATVTGNVREIGRASCRERV